LLPGHTHVPHPVTGRYFTGGVIEQVQGDKCREPRFADKKENRLVDKLKTALPTWSF
jgi:hypothetical protein